MKIVKFFKNNINKYSFQAIIWAFWSLLCFALLTIFLCYITFSMLKIDVFTYQSILWLLIILFFTVILPILIFTIVLIFLFFKEKEFFFSDFFIRNEFLTKNPLYLFICILSFLLEIVLILLSLTLTIRMFVVDTEGTFFIFIHFGFPILIIIFLLYLLARKIFIYK